MLSPTPNTKISAFHKLGFCPWHHDGKPTWPHKSSYFQFILKSASVHSIKVAWITLISLHAYLKGSAGSLFGKTYETTVYFGKGFAVIQGYECKLPHQHQFERSGRSNVYDLSNWRSSSASHQQTKNQFKLRILFSSYTWKESFLVLKKSSYCTNLINWKGNLPAQVVCCTYKRVILSRDIL